MGKLLPKRQESILFKKDVVTLSLCKETCWGSREFRKEHKLLHYHNRSQRPQDGERRGGALCRELLWGAPPTGVWEWNARRGGRRPSWWRAAGSMACRRGEALRNSRSPTLLSGKPAPEEQGREDGTYLWGRLRRFKGQEAEMSVRERLGL